MVLTGMRIEGYKNINFVDLTPDTHMNLVSGKNGAGKSSLIEAMIDAIKGKKEMGKNPQRKIQSGKDKAILEVVLGDGDDALTIKRTITHKDVYLKAERADGNPVSQKDLDKLLDSSTINIMKLLNLDAKEQINFVKKVANIDTSSVEDEYKELYSERTVLNRAVKEEKSITDSFGEVEEVKSINISDLLLKIEQVEKENLQIREDKNKIAEVENFIENNKEDIESLEASIEEHSRKIEMLKSDISKKKEQNASLKKDLKEKTSNMEEERDTTQYRDELKNAEEINRKADLYGKYIESVERFKQAKDKADKVDKKMSDLLKKREDIINSSKLPFKNIELDKDLGLVISGIPFSEMSSAQQIRVISRIYIESNPELKVIYIKDGSLLDDDTIKQISEMSDLKDYQFLVEIVNEVEGSIIMREGSIVGADTDNDEREEL